MTHRNLSNALIRSLPLEERRQYYANQNSARIALYGKRTRQNQALRSRACAGEPGMVLTGIPSDRCEEFWPQIEPILWRAIVRSDGRHSSLTTKHAIQDQNMQLWAAFSDPSMEQVIAACVTQLATYPTGVMDCEIVFAAGDVIPGALPMLDLIGTWAKSAGCTAMTLTGRRGWAKILSSRHSYEESATVLRKRLF